MNQLTHITPQIADNGVDQVDEIDLKELITVIAKGKWFIIIITSIFAIISVFYALSLPNIYKSEALLSPAAEEQGGGLSGLANQFGGLASIAGVNLGGDSGVNDKQLAIEILKSREFIARFIQAHQILPDLMAAISWQLETNQIEYDPELYDVENKKWVREMKPPFKSEPSMQEAYEYFSEIMAINDDQETGMVTLSIEHYSPYIAKQWVDWLISDINKEMKQRDVEEAERSTIFLEKQIELTNVADIRAVLYNLIEEQTKTIMFAEVRDEYIFKTIDSAIIPEKKSKPKRPLICVLGVILGFMISVGLVIARHYTHKK